MKLETILWNYFVMHIVRYFCYSLCFIIQIFSHLKNNSYGDLGSCWCFSLIKIAIRHFIFIVTHFSIMRLWFFVSLVKLGKLIYDIFYTATILNTVMKHLIKAIKGRVWFTDWESVSHGWEGMEAGAGGFGHGVFAFRKQSAVNAAVSLLSLFILPRTPVLME